MTDKESSENQSSSYQKETVKSSEKIKNEATDAKPSQGPETSINISSSSKNITSNDNKENSTVKVANKKTEKTVKSSNNAMKKTEAKSKVSKLAIFALLLAVIALTGIAGLYYLGLEQLNANDIKINQQLNQQAEKLKKENLQAISQQQQNFEQKLAQITADLQASNQEKMSALESVLNLKVDDLSQNQPSDWLVHEAEYLIRIAGRSLWFEKDTQAAISLLNDADLRLQELGDPKYLPVRQLIYQDIEQLKLMPVLETETTILKLMAMAKQVDALTFAMVHIPEATAETENLELTNDPADWQENLAKTWRKFLADFITVSRRSASVEPLMAPQHQENFRQNLKLKLQVAQWAASEGKSTLYHQALSDIEHWLLEYFEQDNLINQNFSASIGQIKTVLISFEYPNDLASLGALRAMLSNDANNMHLSPDEVPHIPLENNQEPQQLEVAPQPETSTGEEII